MAFRRDSNQGGCRIGNEGERRFRNQNVKRNMEETRLKEEFIKKDEIAKTRICSKGEQKFLITKN
jgi:hypothetical protein